MFYPNYPNLKYNLTANEERHKRGSRFGDNLNIKRKALNDKTNLRITRLSAKEIEKVKSNCLKCKTTEPGFLFRCDGCKQWYHHLCYPTLKSKSIEEVRIMIYEVVD